MKTRTSSFAIAVVVLLAFAPVVSNGWVSWDDPEAILTNDALTSSGVVGWAFSSSLMSHFQPLSWLVWSALARISGLGPRPFHLLSLFVHAVNAVLVFLLVARLCRGETRLSPSLAPVAATLLYAIHPLRVEPVAWASAFPYLLSTSFLLVATLLYLDDAKLPALVTYGLSLLARPIAPGFPLVLLALDRFAKGRKWDRAVVRETWPFFVLAAVGLGLEARARSFVGLDVYGPLARVSLAAESLVAHVTGTLWPVGLTPLDPLPLEPRFEAGVVALGAALLAATGAAAFFSRRRLPSAPALWLAWIVLLFPSLGLAPSGLQATADRYSYLPAIVIAVAVGALLARFSTRVSVSVSVSVVVVALALALAAVLGAATFHQSRFWKSSLTLWTRAVDVDSDNELAFYFQATALAEAGRLDDARRAYESALRLVPDYAPARKDLARLEAREADRLASRGELARASEFYRRALELDPEIADVRERRAMTLFQQGRLEEALPELEAVAEKGASSPEVFGALAIAFGESGHLSEAVDALERGIAAFPDDLALAHNLARLLATQLPGREDRAVALAERVVEGTGGREPRALDTLGFALAARGSRQEALRAFERAFDVARAAGDENLAREIAAHARSVAR